MNGLEIPIERVLAGIRRAQEVGLAPIKLNAVVQRGVNDHTVLDLVDAFADQPVAIRFIEYMDVGNLNGWKLQEVMPADEIISLIDAEMPLEPVESGYRGEVALRYRYRDGGGEVGIIASVTRPFCGDCTRLRLSPEGRLVTCLFATLGTDLRGPVRSGASDADLEQLIRGVWSVREDRYSEQRASMTEPREKVEMYHIGG
jgi:cyclic pyranopterin phosphate synthase